MIPAIVDAEPTHFVAVQAMLAQAVLMRNAYVGCAVLAPNNRP
jgi:hypothetical protein